MLRLPSTQNAVEEIRFHANNKTVCICSQNYLVGSRSAALSYVCRVYACCMCVWWCRVLTGVILSVLVSYLDRSGGRTGVNTHRHRRVCHPLPPRVRID